MHHCLRQASFSRFIPSFARVRSISDDIAVLLPGQSLAREGEKMDVLMMTAGVRPPPSHARVKKVKNRSRCAHVCHTLAREGKKAIFSKNSIFFCQFIG